MRRRWLAVSLLMLLSGAALTARAWHEKEHAGIVAVAGRVLAADPSADDPLPAFFLRGLPGDAAQCSVDPDVFKLRKLAQLEHAETPEHYIDIEFLGGAGLPELRFDFYRWCYEHDLDPTTVGTLPYAVTEWTQRLAMAFAEHRARPDDPAIRRKCLVYAGLLAHYAADLCQPLHTTIHYDGRVDEPGDKSPGSGIHMKIDPLLRKLDDDFVDLVRDERATVYDDVFDAVVAELHASHALVDRLYALEPAINATDDRITDEALEAFAIDRLRASVRFTASLYRTAWAKSTRVAPPHWLDRDQLLEATGIER